MCNAQLWLDETYPIERRNNIKRIGYQSGKLFTISHKVPADLTGKFINFRGFTNLTELNLPYRKIGLESITSFPVSLQILQLASNYFPPSTLEPFAHLINLIKLDIGTFDSKDHDHNQWYGSLIYLKEMKNLNWFCGASTNLDCGLEYLPKHKFENLGFRSDFPDSKCLKLRKILKLINYDLSQFNPNFYNEEYLNYQQLLHDFKLISKEVKNIGEIGSGHYVKIKDGLKKTEAELEKKITDLENLILIIENKNSELNNFHSQMKLIKNKLNIAIITSFLAAIVSTIILFAVPMLDVTAPWTLIGISLLTFLSSSGVAIRRRMVKKANNKKLAIELNVIDQAKELPNIELNPALAQGSGSILSEQKIALGESTPTEQRRVVNDSFRKNQWSSDLSNQQTLDNSVSQWGINQRSVVDMNHQSQLVNFSSPTSPSPQLNLDPKTLLIQYLKAKLINKEQLWTDYLDVNNILIAIPHSQFAINQKNTLQNQLLQFLTISEIGLLLEDNHYYQNNPQTEYVEMIEETRNPQWIPTGNNPQLINYRNPQWRD